MGREARAKQQAWSNGTSVSRGNPSANPLMIRYITQKAFEAAVRRGDQFRATYSDRAYVMDKHGTLRRAPVPVAAPPPAPTAAFTQS